MANIKSLKKYGKELFNYILNELNAYGVVEQLQDYPMVDVVAPKYKRQKSLYDIRVRILFTIKEDDITPQDKGVFEKFTDCCVYDFLQNNPSPDSKLIIKQEKWEYDDGSKYLSSAEPYLFKDNGDYDMIQDWFNANGVGLYIRLGVKDNK